VDLFFSDVFWSWGCNTAKWLTDIKKELRKSFRQAQALLLPNMAY
jgi:hypothetical protein